MALINSLFSGVSGLRNHQTMIDVIGNNISNVNTVGFKGSRVTFSDAFHQFVRSGVNPTENIGGTSAFQIGLGSKVNSIDRNWTQGSFERTGIITDLALQGPGLFILKADNQIFFSRAGAFRFDSEGKLVNPQNGAVVQGKIANAQGQLPPGNTYTDIKIDKNMRIPALPTTQIKWAGNLSSSSPLTRSERVYFTGNLESDGTFPFIRTSRIYDDFGNEYTLQTTFEQNGVGDYLVSYQILDANGNSVTTGGPINLTFDANGDILTPTNPENVTGPNGINFNIDFSGLRESTATNTVSTVVDNNREANVVIGAVTIFDSLGTSHTMTIKFTKLSNLNWSWTVSVPASSGTLANNSGTITFNSNGTIAGINPSIPQVQFNPTGGADPQIITLDFGEGFNGITQTSVNSVVSAVEQNGTAASTLANLNIDKYGNIIGVFTNGYTRTLAQILVATFANVDGLISVGDNMYQVSANAGNPVVGELGENTATTLESGALETSNVDLAEEFTRMIIAQRGFEANSKIITTSDQMLQVITNLVR